MSTYRISTEPFGSAVRGGFAMPTFGGTALRGSVATGIAGSAADSTRERHLGATAVATADPSNVWADVVATQPKRNQGTQVWSPPT